MKTFNALISANNISVIKNQKSILRDIDIEINKKQYYGEAGHNKEEFEGQLCHLEIPEMLKK